MDKKMAYKKFTISQDLARKARLLAIAGDPVRIRILCFMFVYKKACVSDIAKSLGVSVPSLSHHLQIMRDNGFFVTERIGQNICYVLIESEFTKRLEKIIC